MVTLSDAEKGIQKGGEDPDDPAVDFDTELDYSANQEQLLVKRANEILMNVWIAYDTRMYSKSTPKVEFFENNMEKARALAVKELEEERIQAKSEEVSSAVLDLVLCVYTIDGVMEATDFYVCVSV